MRLLSTEKTEILEALEKEYRRCIKQLFEGQNNPAEEDGIREKITTIRSAMDKITSMK